MHHSFDVDHARLYGLTEAVLIGNFQFWIAKNRANGENLIDGRTWTYNSIKAWAEIFPYLSIDQVRRGVASLVKQGILVSGNFNASAVDRTKWYAFADEKAFLPDSANLPNRSHKAPNAIGKNAESLNKTDVNQMQGRGARLATDWVLPKAWGEWALSCHPAWNADHVRKVGTMFRNHWVAKSGKDASKTDWFATWQNWVMREPAVPPGVTPPPGTDGRSWWQSVAGIQAKGKELGCLPLDDEAFPYYKLRVYKAAGDGPWHDAAERAAAPMVEGMKKAALPVDVVAEREKMKAITRGRGLN